MRTTKRDDGWWIVDCPEGIDEMGPYTTRREADEDRIGVQRWLRLKQWEISSKFRKGQRTVTV